MRAFLCSIDESVWDAVDIGWTRPEEAKSTWDKTHDEFNIGLRKRTKNNLLRNLWAHQNRPQFTSLNLIWAMSQPRRVDKNNRWRKGASIYGRLVILEKRKPRGKIYFTSQTSNKHSKAIIIHSSHTLISSIGPISKAFPLSLMGCLVLSWQTQSRKHRPSIHVTKDSITNWILENDFSSQLFKTIVNWMYV